MKKHVLLYITFFLLIAVPTTAQMAYEGQEREEKNAEYLLLNKGLQFRITEAVNSLYNFDFKTAENGFLVMSYTYPEHPLPYFLMGLSQWWKIAPDTDNQEYDALFHKYM